MQQGAELACTQQQRSRHTWAQNQSKWGSNWSHPSQLPRLAALADVVWLAHRKALHAHQRRQPLGAAVENGVADGQPVLRHPPAEGRRAGRENQQPYIVARLGGSVI